MLPAALNTSLSGATGSVSLHLQLWSTRGNHLLLATHISVILTSCFVLPAGKTGELIKTGFFDMWAGGALDLCSSSWGTYAHKWQSPSFLVQMWLPWSRFWGKSRTGRSWWWPPLMTRTQSETETRGRQDVPLCVWPGDNICLPTFFLLLQAQRWGQAPHFWSGQLGYQHFGLQR